MRANEGLPRVVVGLTKRLLRLYPADFRRQFGARYLAAAEHRWLLETRRRGRWATVRTVVVLLLDAAMSVPTAHWRARNRQSEVGGGSRRRVLAFMTGLGMDVRLAARSLARRSAFALLVVATLGLGIGASAAVFGALDRVILRPLPYADADRFVYLSIRQVELGWNLAPFNELIESWRASARTVERIETYRQASGVLQRETEAEIVDVTAMSGGMPGMLGVRPLVGRMLGISDATPGAIPVVMVSERYWRSAWGSDAEVVGRTIVLNDTIFTIAGVWPEAARLDYEGSPAFFRVVPPNAESPVGDFTLVLARITRGVTPADVEAELGSLLRNSQAPEGTILSTWLPTGDLDAVVVPPYGLLGDSYVSGLWMVFAGGIVLMIVAVFNAVNLVLGRSASRTGEMAIRLALGGSRARLARLFLAESSLLALLGAILGFAVAFLVEQSLAHLEPGRLVPAGATDMQGRAILFACSLAVLSALFCALVPLLHTRFSNLRDQLAGSGSSRDTARPSRLRAFLIAAQSALAVLLVTAAALVGRSFVSLLSVDVGLDLDRIAIIAIRAPASVGDSPEALTAFFSPIEEALVRTPGVSGVTTAPNPPLAYSVRRGLPVLTDEPEPVLDGSEFVSTTSVPPGHFQVTGIPILRGRDFMDREDHVVIVNDAFAHSRQQDVLGRTLRFTGDTIVRTIVGVVGNVRSWGLEDADDRIQIYYPDADRHSEYTRFLLRTDASPAAVLHAARTRIASIHPDVPLRQAATGPSLIRERTARIRFVAFLLAAFAILGVLFAITGVYGAVSLDVNRRAREVGVRIALGASRRDVSSAVLLRGLRPVLAGASVGLVAALWAGPVLESVLFRVPARDPLSTLLGVLLLTAAATLACLLPARRACRVDPVSTLRAG